jgi:hypothetical protein
MQMLVASARALLAVAVSLGVGAGVCAQSRPKPRRGASGRAARPTGGQPGFDARHSEWIRRKESAAAAGADGPDALTQYLVEEIVVTGVFDADGGDGVFLFARPTGTTFFAAAGAVLYNGRLAEIRRGESGFVEDTEVVFVESAGKAGGRTVVKRVEAAPATERPASNAPEAPGGPA